MGSSPLGCGMTRSVRTTNHGGDFFRHTVRIESDPCEEGDFRALATLFQTIFMNQPDLVRHNAPCPALGRFFWESGHWVIESENIAPRPPQEE